MKVLFFLNEFPKLSETFILNQITGLIDKGIDVRILAKNKEQNSKVHQDIIDYRLLEKVIYYGNIDKKSKFKQGIDYIKNFIKLRKNKQINGEIRKMGLKKNKELILLLSNFSDFADYYDVIHAHFGPNGLLAEKLINLNIIKGNLFTTFHGYDVVSYLKKNGNSVYDNLKSKSTLLPISEFWKKKLLEIGFDTKDIIVHRMGIDVKKFNFSPKLPDQKIELKLLSVARLVEKKGIVYAINAVNNLVKKGYKVKYFIVGGGPLFQSFREKIDKENLSENIILLGWKTQDEVIELLREVSVLILPSITTKDGDMEGIPVILMEAMAMGKIVISTYHSGIPELIKNDFNGFLVNERDSESIYLLLKKIIELEKNCNDIVINARKTIMEYYNIEKLNSELINIFRDRLGYDQDNENARKEIIMTEV